MFSTFTGNSRRPRNVNLSGQAGNPFANTSWSPSNASNASKTVQDAQADREKRRAEQQRLKAAAKIQRTWRGHRARSQVHDSQRAVFDGLYASTLDPSKRLSQSFALLLSFFTCQRHGDIRRLATYAHESNSVNLHSIAPIGTHQSRIQQLVRFLIEAIECTASNRWACRSALHVLANIHAEIAPTSSRS